MFEGIGPWTYPILCDGFMVPVTFSLEGNRFFLTYRFNKKMNELIKSAFKYRWHGKPSGTRNQWSIEDSARTRFQLAYLAHPKRGDVLNPYTRYETPVPENKYDRKQYIHQNSISDFVIHTRQCVVAGEMGVGKTLALISVIEKFLYKDWIWVAPRAALASVKLEFAKWKSPAMPTFVTYEGLQKLLEQWPSGKPAPFGLVGDEISRCKNPDAKRSIAMQRLADEIRKEHGSRGIVCVMSGTPSPKSPTDWWSICEIACPGFLREGSVKAMRNRLAFVERNELVEGAGTFDKITGWRDDSTKCNVCGLTVDDVTHENDPMLASLGVSTMTHHAFVPSTNEVAKLHSRMSGLCIFVLKKDCLDLPEKVYDIIRCSPTRSVINAASSIVAKSSSTVAGMTLLRELSDGFQYTRVQNGTQTCTNCKGHGMESCQIPVLDEDGIAVFDESGNPVMTGEAEEVPCGNCLGTGQEGKYDTVTTELPCPKVDVLRNLLEEYEDVGRIVIYGGFTGSIDRIVKTCGVEGWDIIRVDGRGWHTNMPGLKSDTDMAALFQSKDPRKIAFIGHPGSAGMGLTLTASPVIVYYSNDFNAESRIQSEDRIHRAGMDASRGARIIDIVHLPTDEQVITNLRNKRRLQSITMGEIISALGVS